MYKSPNLESQLRNWAYASHAWWQDENGEAKCDWCGAVVGAYLYTGGIKRGEVDLCPENPLIKELLGGKE